MGLALSLQLYGGWQSAHQALLPSTVSRCTISPVLASVLTSLLSPIIDGSFGSGAHAARGAVKRQWHMCHVLGAQQLCSKGQPLCPSLEVNLTPNL